MTSEIYQSFDGVIEMTYHDRDGTVKQKCIEGITTDIAEVIDNDYKKRHFGVAMYPDYFGVMVLCKAIPELFSKRKQWYIFRTAYSISTLYTNTVSHGKQWDCYKLTISDGAIHIKHIER